MTNGFTLAEVLITLAIIGVVAALTIPTLVSKYQEKATVVRVKKFYSDFSHAYQLAIIDNGTIDMWDLGDTNNVIEDEDGNTVPDEETLKNYDKFFEIMRPYLKNISYTKLTAENSGTAVTKGVTARGYVLPNGISIAALNLASSACIHDKSYCGDFYITTDGGPVAEVDSNGKKKMRNTVFAFILRKNTIVPFGLSNSEFTSQCLSGENVTRCTGWVIKNGNMDYLHCKDLNIDTKTKCD